jgi:hypothetical protein
MPLKPPEANRLQCDDVVDTVLIAWLASRKSKERLASFSQEVRFLNGAADLSEVRHINFKFLNDSPALISQEGAISGAILLIAAEYSSERGPGS